MGKVANTIRDIFRLALLVTRKGSLRVPPPDYAGMRARILEEIPRTIFDPDIIRTNRRPTAIKAQLLSIPFIRLAAGNIAFIRNPEKSYAQYFVSHEKKLVYIRIFKCGSTSILKSFLPLVHQPFATYPLKTSSIDSVAHHLVQHTLPDFSGYTIFAVTRNPLERLVSAYLDVFNPPHQYPDTLFNIFRNCRTLKDVVMLLDRIPDRYRGPHFVSQTTILNSVKSQNVLRFNLDSAGRNTQLESFLNDYGMAMHLENRTASPYDFRSFYDAETLDLAYRIYKEDFEILGYRDAYIDLKKAFESGWHGKLSEASSGERPISS